MFFLLRKKTTHVSFLHTYHHAVMVMAGWIGVRFLGGGHTYFLGFANCFVHIILYSYYLVTAYNSKYGQLIWLKKLITQAQLVRICVFGNEWDYLFTNFRLNLHFCFTAMSDCFLLKTVVIQSFLHSC